MRNIKKILSAVLAATLVLSGISVPTEVQAASTNLALGATATGSNVESGTEFYASNAIDGNLSTRWGTDQNAQNVNLKVDLGSEKSFNQMMIFFERYGADQNITKFHIDVDGTTVYTKEGRAAQVEIVPLDTTVEGQEVVLYIDTYDGGTANWASVSIYEFQIFNVPTVYSQSGYTKVNGLKATAPSEITSSHQGEGAWNGQAWNSVDGDTSTYWHSAWGGSVDDSTNPAISDTKTSIINYIQVELPKATDVAGVTYLPRQNGSYSNGAFDVYQVMVSADGSDESWKAVEIETLNGGDAPISESYGTPYIKPDYSTLGFVEQELIFTEVQSGIKYVRFVAKETYAEEGPSYTGDGFMNAAELGVLKKTAITEVPAVAISTPEVGKDAPTAAVTLSGYVGVDIAENPVELSGDFKMVGQETINDTLSSVFKGTFTVAGDEKIDRDAYTRGENLVINFWYRRDTAPAANTYVLQKIGDSTEYVLTHSDSSKLTFYANTTGNGSGGLAWPQFNTSVSDSWAGWHEITICFTSDMMDIYVDDTLMTNERLNYDYKLVDKNQPFTLNPSNDENAYFANFKMYTGFDESVYAQSKDSLITSLSSAEKLFEIGEKQVAVVPEEYSVSTIWKDENDQEVTEFVAGNTYTAEIVLTANDSYYFAESAMPEQILLGETSVDANAVLSEDKTVMTMTCTCTIPAINKAELDALSITLEGNIGVNYKMTATDTLADNAYMQFTVDGNTKTVTVADAKVDANGRYVFTCEVCAPEMTETIIAQMFDADGNALSESTSYSVQYYAEQMLTKLGTDDAYAELVALLKAMLNYGAYAQTEFGVNTDNLANTVLADAERTLAELTLDTMEVKTEYTVASALEELIGKASLILNSKTDFRQYLTTATMDGYTFKLSDTTLDLTTGVDNENGYVQVNNIPAAELDNAYVLTVSETDGVEIGTVQFSPLNYVQGVLENVGTDAEDASLVNVAKALYWYNDAANDYFE